MGPAATPFGVTQTTISSTSLNAITAKAGTKASVSTSIKKMTTENFAATLATIEPWLLEGAGSTSYAKTLKRISRKAKEIGTAVPAGYAKDSKTTLKRRTKQDEFIKTKEEGRIAAEEEAKAEAAAAVEAAAAEKVAAEEAAAAAAAAPADEPEPEVAAE